MRFGWLLSAAGPAMTLGAGQALAQDAPHLGGGGGVQISIVRILLSLVLCIALAVAAILLLRRQGGLRWPTFNAAPGRSRAVDIVETRRMSIHADMCLVRYDGREFLLVVQQGNMHVVRERAVPDAEAAV